jgi:RHS repeat-associated protein
VTKPGLNLHTGDLHSSGDTLGDFGSRIAQGGDSLQKVGEDLVSHSSADKSGVGKIVTSTLGRVSEVAGKVFSEGGRVAGAAGKRLHVNASNHEQNETDVAGSFTKIRQPPDNPKTAHGGGTPKGPPHSPEPGGTPKDLPTVTPKDEPGGPTHTSSADSGSSDIKAHNTHPSENDTPTGNRPAFADPIDMTTGRMTLTQVDVELAGVLPLVVARTHVASYRLGRWFGASWASTPDQRIEIDDEGVYFAAEDGTLLTFPRPMPEQSVLPVSGPRWELSLREDDSYALVKPETGEILFFAPTGTGRLPITGITDTKGHRIRFEYQDGVLTGINHSAGYRIGVLTEGGVITTLRLLGDGTTQDVDLIQYRYVDGRLTEVVNSSGRPLRFEYDDAGRVVRWVDRNGMWYRYGFDEHGRCVRAEGADGHLDATFTYDRDNLVHTATDSLGHTTTFRLNERLQIAEQIDPLGSVTRSEWDPFDRLTARTDPLGHTTRYDYDAAGNLTGVTRPDGSRQVAEYDERRVPVTVVTADGAVWRQETDDTGRVSSLVDPLGVRTTYTYDDAGNLATVTDALGNVTRTEWNAAGLPVTVTDPLGATTRYTYDQFGRPQRITDPLGGVTVLSWTVEGLPLTERTPDGAARRWSYDGEGNVRETVDPLGQVSQTEIAHFDLPVVRRDPDGTELRYAYDTELRLTEVTNQQGRRWRYEYDAAGRMVRETDFDGREVRYTYDAAGRTVGRTNAVGQTVTWTWDLLGRQVGKRVGAEETTFGYDAEDRMVSARGAGTELAFAYDALGRVLAETVDGRVVASGYDPLGRRISRRSPSGARSTWDYDAAGRPAALRTDGPTMAFRRDPAGREVERRMDGMLLAQAWDSGHRLTSQTLLSPTRRVQGRQYGYRPDGTLTTVRDDLSGARRYDVDTAGRVTAVHGDGWAERYAYDPAGNLTLAGWPVPRHGSADSAAAGEREYTGALLTRAGTVRYEHDAEGRMVARHRSRSGGGDETWRYTWDGEDRLVGVLTPDGQAWRYLYDPLGRRVAKQRRTPDGRVADQVVFTWDGDQLVEQVHNGSRALVWDWAPDSHQVVAQRERGVTDREWVDRRFFAIVTDLVGMPTELVDQQGNLAWHADTTLWGGLLSGPGSAYTPLRFPGQYHDAETGLYYNFHRYYDPATGRFATHDPLGLAAAPNSQTYVDNPTGWIDPLGLTPCPVDELHKNPTGTSLRMQGPLLPKFGNKQTPNIVPDQKTWSHIVTNKDKPGLTGMVKQKLSTNEDAHTFAETHRLTAGLTRANRDRMNPTNGNLTARPGAADTFEAMGRRDPATQPYWQKQDARDERLANDAVGLAARNPQRSGMDRANDSLDVFGTTTKLQGVQNLLGHNDGVMIGTDHRSDPAFPFLTNNMSDLKQSGVKTIYMEGIRDDGHQAMVDNYMRTGRMDPGLASHLGQTPGMRDTVEAARTHGVDIQGIGGRPARSPSDLPYGIERNHARATMFNTYSTQAVGLHRQGIIDAGGDPGKYIVDAGKNHGYSHTGPATPVTIQGVPLPATTPGVGDILNIPVVRTDPTNDSVFEAL